MTRLLFLFFIFISNMLAAESLLLSGKVEDEQAQYFSAPWTNTWRVQVKWLMKEGMVAKPGDAVVRFDTSNLESEVEQRETALRQAEQQALEEGLRLEKEFINAQFEWKKAKLRLQKTELSAKVPKRFYSDYEYAQVQFDWVKAKDTLKRAFEQMNLKEKAYRAEQEKQQLKVELIKQQLARTKTLLDSMELKAKMEGPVFYALHPWTGTKIQEGSTVQTTMQVASISGGGELQVKAWVNEIDWPKLKKGLPVKIVFDVELDREFVGLIKSVGTQSEVRKEWGESAWYPVTVSVESKEFSLVPGMSALVEVDLSSHPQNFAEIKSKSEGAQQ
ncbi:HlyD family secretion protein [Pleionea sediminis]|uniref:HlyD family secretion protein n=1 Tax=Pleionea sediminis TaxID=2569479 RepID=UPI0013DE635E|nr:HlyD family efflux transporter periplasmic adaptor subunit [Pleionea sediminis]